jgi:hypothetical protein
MIAAPLALGLKLFRAVPLWAWAVIAALLWGGWQHRRADLAVAELARERAEAAILREQAVSAALAETQRRIAAQQEIADAAERKARRARDDAAAAGAAADRLRQYAAELAASAAACNSAPAAFGEAASAPAVVLADMLGRLEARGRDLAAEADRRGIAGSECAGRYDALTQ